MRRFLAIFPAITMTMTITIACGPAREAMWERPAQPAPTAPPTATFEPDAASMADQAWAARADRIELERAIAIWERMASEGRANAKTLARLSRAYFLLAESFMTPTGENGTTLKVYDKGIAAGERAMVAASPEFANRVHAGESVESALAVMPRGGQAALYWYASNLGRFVSSDVTTAAMYKDRIHAVMQRVLEIDPEFFCAGAHRYLGAFYARAPAFLGGSLERSKDHFDRAIAIAPHFLDNKVLLAEFYASKTEDRDLYRRLLTEVTEADPTILPDLVPEQTLAQRRARALLAEPAGRF
jgi:tetratricopeptide (TPR) repeat protein